MARASFVQNKSGENFFILFYGIYARNFQRQEPFKGYMCYKFVKEKLSRQKEYITKEDINTYKNIKFLTKFFDALSVK